MRPGRGQPEPRRMRDGPQRSGRPNGVGSKETHDGKNACDVVGDGLGSVG